MLGRMTLLSLSFLPLAAAGTLTAGDPLPQAAAVQITAAGFSNLGGAVGQLVPESVLEDLVEGEFSCDDSSTQKLSYTVTNLELFLNVARIEIIPSDGRLDVYLGLEASATAEKVRVTGKCSFLTFNETCDLDIPAEDPILIDLHIGLGMALNDAGVIEVTVDEPELTLSPIDNPLIESTKCGMSDVIAWQLENDPEFINNLIWEFLGPTLSDLGPSLEEPLEDALASLNLSTSLALGDASVDLALFPSALELTSGGMFLGLGAEIAPSAISECVEAGDGPEVTMGGWPTVGDRSWDGAVQHDAAILLSKDFTDALLWSVWAGGALCVEVNELAGASLGTSLLGQLFGDDFKALFPEDVPAGLKIDPRLPPTSHFDGEMPLYLDVAGLGIGAAADLDHRMARICEVGLDGSIGVALPLTESALTPELIIDEQALAFSEAWTELIGPGYAAGVADFLPTVIGSVLPADLLPTVALPSWQGIGLGDADWQASEDGQWVAAYATLSTEAVTPLEISGCDALGCGGDGGGDLGSVIGCDDSSGGCGGDAGCEDSSCVSSPRLRFPGGRLLLFTGFIALAMRRRKP